MCSNLSQQLHIVINPIIVLRTVSAEHFDTQSFVLVGHMAAQKGNVRHFFGTMEGVSVKLNLSSPNHFIKKKKYRHCKYQYTHFNRWGEYNLLSHCHESFWAISGLLSFNFSALDKNNTVMNRLLLQPLVHNYFKLQSIYIGQCVCGRTAHVLYGINSHVKLREN